MLKKPLFILIAIAILFVGCASKEDSSLPSTLDDTTTSQGTIFDSSSDSVQGEDLVSNSDSSQELSSDSQEEQKQSATKKESKKNNGESQKNTTSKAKPAPLSPVSSTVTDPNHVTVTISVECKTATEKGNSVALAVSSNGIILAPKKLTLKKSATVYDALSATGLIIGSNSSAMGTYVYSIQSLAEKMCGGTSGWLYFVNDKCISLSSSSCVLKDGDNICWKYSCDNGNDLQ